MSRSAAVPLLLGLLVACQPAAETPAAAPAAPAAPAALTAEDLAAIRAVDSTWGAAMSVGDTATAASLYTDDAVMQGPDAPAIVGRAAISASLGQLVAMKPADVRLTADQVAGAGDLAYAVGTFTMTVDGKPMAGHFTEVFRKGADGRWRYHVDAYGFHPAAK